MPSPSIASNQEFLLTKQYHNANNLEARIALHQRFSTNKENFQRWIFEQLNLPKQARILEIGCGPASLWRDNTERIDATWHITLGDLSQGMLEQAQHNLADVAHRFTFQQLDAQDLPFDAASFDAIIANHMLYHVPNLGKALAEMQRVLKPAGYFYAATNGNEHMRELEDFISTTLANYLPAEKIEPASRVSFNLENGADILAQAFDTISLQRLPNNALNVSEAQPLFAYICSMGRFMHSLEQLAETQKEALLSEMMAALEARVALEPFRISKATGIFTAS